MPTKQVNHTIADRLKQAGWQPRLVQRLMDECVLAAQVSRSTVTRSFSQEIKNARVLAFLSDRLQVSSTVLLDHRHWLPGPEQEERV